VKLLLLAALAGAAVAQTAAAQNATAQTAAARPSSNDPCFFIRDVGDRTVAGPRTLYFKVKDRAHMHALAYYRVDLREACGAGTRSSTQHNGFLVGSSVPAAGASSRICSAADLRIAADDHGPICPVADMTQVSPSEIAALPRRLRP
jgi:hypothetical protein